MTQTTPSALESLTLAASDIMSVSIVKQCKYVPGRETGVKLQLHQWGVFPVITLNQRPEKANPRPRLIKNFITVWNPSNTLWTLPNTINYVDEVLGPSPGSWSERHKNSANCSQVLVHDSLRDRVCPVEECDYVVPENTPVCDHLIHSHIDLSHRLTPSSLTDIIISTGNNPDQFQEISRLSSAISRQLPLSSSFMYLFI